MENDVLDLAAKYDSICLHTMINLYTLTKDQKVIRIRNFDWSNDEHKFVIAVLAATAGIIGDKAVLIDGSWSNRRSVNKKYKKILGKVNKLSKKDNGEGIDVPNLLEFMRGTACELIGTDFRFGDIYHAYYE